MDYNKSPNEYPSTVYNKSKGGPFASAAMFLGIAGIFTTMMATVFPPFALCGVAIVLAILSKGSARKLLMQAKVGIICSIAGLVLNLTLIGSSVNYVLNNPEILIQTAQTYDRMCEQMYGIPSEELFGESMEDMVNNLYNN